MEKIQVPTVCKINLFIRQCDTNKKVFILVMFKLSAHKINEKLMICFTKEKDNDNLSNSRKFIRCFMLK